jgi:monoamine oxidase
MNHNEMLDIIETGLTGTSRAKRILIVGAGIAGLVAGDLLKRVGHKVTILEAQHRLGGRIYTVRSGLATGLQAEMGAIAFPQSHALTMAYLDRFHLSTESLITYHPNRYIHLHGKRVQHKDFDPKQFGVEVPSHATGKSPSEWLQATFKPFYDLVRKQGESAWDEIIEHYDQFSLEGYLRHAGWSAGAIDLFSIFDNAATYLNSSFVSYLRYTYAATSANTVYLVDGSDALPKAFLPFLSENIKFGATVQAIEHTATEVTVSYNSLVGRCRQTADFVIVTIPVNLLRQIKITPPLSPRKRRAINHLSYDSSGRIFIQCRSRFWETEENIYGGYSVTDLPIGTVHYPQHGRETGRGVLCVNHSTQIDGFSSLPQDYLIRQAIEHLRQIHPQIDHIAEVAVAHHWGQDPYAGGVGALLEPGTLSKFNDVVAPEGRIYFAGEHCSKFDHRWVQGAIESAIVAANSVHQARLSEGQSLSQSYLEQIRQQMIPAAGVYHPDTHPKFYQTLQTHFPGALPMTDYMAKTYQCLSAYDFSDENTMGMISICRDEIADSLFVEVMRYWGKTFNCCSLAGFIMMGKTGLAAAMDHTPISENIRRFTFYAMPHIAISEAGEIGVIYRNGIQKISHACGALNAIVKELTTSCPRLEMDMQDIEQTIIRQKILSTLNYGDKPDLIEITKLAAQIISKDVEKLLNTLDRSVFKYAVMTGIQIHGPQDTHWIYPQDFYVVGSDLADGKEPIEIFLPRKTEIPLTVSA